MITQKIQQLFLNIFDKQKKAFAELTTYFHDHSQQIPHQDHNNNMKNYSTPKENRQITNPGQHNNNDSSFKKISKNQSRGTPINGFKYQNQASLQQQQGDLPRPSITNFTNKNSFQDITNLNKQQEMKKREIQYSIVTNRQENPQQFQQIGHLRHVCGEACSDRVKKKQIKSQNRNQNVKGEYNRSKNHQNYLPIVKKSVRTENLLAHESEQKSKDMTDVSKLTKQFTRRNQLKKKSNIKLESNVVSYCQSLKESSIGGLTKFNGSVQLQTSGQREVKKPGHIRVKKMRYQTQQKQKIENIKNQIQNQFKQIKQKHEDIKVQLKVFYEKKKRIQQKLKKLNTEMSQINNSQVFTSQSPYLQNPYLIPRPKQRQLFAGQIIHIGHLKANTSKQQKHQKQLQKSRKAIQFVQKMSKQSLRRRIEHQKKIKKDIYNRVKEHACIDCSRVRCHIEVMEGQARKQAQFIPLDRSRIK